MISEKTLLPVKFWGFLLLSILPFAQIQAGVIILNGLSHHHKVATGNRYQGTIELQNTGDGPLAIRVYQKDYRFYHTGEALYDAPGTEPRSNAKWIDFSPNHLVLAAKEKSIIKYEITVPAGADTLKGTFWSVLMVEGMNPVDTSSLEKGFHVNTVIRYAIQISSSFAETGTADLKFLKVNLKKEDGQPVLQVDLENDGERYLQAELVLEFFNKEGISAGVFKSERRTTYPGTSITVDIPLTGSKAGFYKALLVANCSEDDVFGLNLTIDLKDD